MHVNNKLYYHDDTTNVVKLNSWIFYKTIKIDKQNIYIHF